jgi:hypothetical protein
MFSDDMSYAGIPSGLECWIRRPGAGDWKLLGEIFWREKFITKYFKVDNVW